MYWIFFLCELNVSLNKTLPSFLQLNKRIFTRICRHTLRAGLKPIGPIAPSWAPRPIQQTLVQVDWEPGPTEIVPNWAPHLLRPALHTPPTSSH